MGWVLDYRGGSTGLRHQTEETLLRTNLIDTDGAKFFLVTHVEEGEGVDRASEGGKEVLDAVGQGPALQVKRRPGSNGVSVDVKDLGEGVDEARVGQLISGDTAECHTTIFAILDGNEHHLGRVAHRLETQGDPLQGEVGSVDQTGCLETGALFCFLAVCCG